jgi:hypothetical protein
VVKAGAIVDAAGAMGAVSGPLRVSLLRLRLWMGLRRWLRLKARRVRLAKVRLAKVLRAPMAAAGGAVVGDGVVAAVVRRGRWSRRAVRLGAMMLIWMSRSLARPMKPMSLLRRL